jgi:fructokinase
VRALVIGEALIDIVTRDGRVVGEHVGGSPLNVAVGLGLLGRSVDLLTYIADDARGRRIIDHLDRAGVGLVRDSVRAARTPTAIATLDEKGSAHYEFDIEWQLTGTAEVRPPLVVHTGSIATVLEPGCRAAAALVDTYRTSATVTFDPNARPRIIDDTNTARARIERMIEKADVVKASEEDLRFLDPDRSVEQIARTWLDSGPSIVAVTLGARGAAAWCAAGPVRVPAFHVQVVDTVGAGDAFMSGLIDALWSRGLLGAEQRRALAAIGTETLTDVVRTAVLSSALTVSKPGADLPDRETRDAAMESAILG